MPVSELLSLCTRLLADIELSTEARKHLHEAPVGPGLLHRVPIGLKLKILSLKTALASLADDRLAVKIIKLNRQFVSDSELRYCMYFNLQMKSDKENVAAERGKGIQSEPATSVSCHNKTKGAYKNLTKETYRHCDCGELQDMPDSVTLKFWSLTLRERQILDRVLVGDTTKIISFSLGISRRTVENHRASIMKKMGCHSIAGLARLAFDTEVHTPSTAVGT